MLGLCCKKEEPPQQPEVSGATWVPTTDEDAKAEELDRFPKKPEPIAEVQKQPADPLTTVKDALRSLKREDHLEFLVAALRETNSSLAEKLTIWPNLEAEIKQVKERPPYKDDIISAEICREVPEPPPAIPLPETTVAKAKRASLVKEDEPDADDVLNQTEFKNTMSDGGLASTPISNGRKSLQVVETGHGATIIQAPGGDTLNKGTIMGSVLTKGLFMQVVIYTLALGGVGFVLFAAATNLGGEDSSGSSAEGSARLLSEDASSFLQSITGGWATPAEVYLDENGHPRRLGGGVSPLMYNVSFCLLGAGLMALIVNLLGLPLILGYLLGGLLVGPTGLDIVPTHTEIAGLANLGLVFLLFMIGLELNLSELLKMGKVVIMTGLLQFPICAGLHIGVFLGLESAGISWGTGKYATLYCGLVCGISSTMIVVKLLSEKLELDTQPGRLTIGILIFQDVWAIIVLAIQPNLANPEIVGILKTFGLVAVLILFSYLYAKFVMPAVFFKASGSVELMLVLSLAWCFFIGCFAILPFIGLSLELAALISGAVLATFPYSAEFNGKIKYLRDFFVTLFFVAMGMQIPVPSAEPIGKALIIVGVVLVGRWIGICGVVNLAGGGARLGIIATMNLSQVSEFALVIVSLGVSFEHVNEDTLTIMIWAFSILAIASSYFVQGNHKVYSCLSGLCCKSSAQQSGGGDGHGEDHEERDIVMLGFHRIASMLIAEFEQKNPAILHKINVVDVNQNIRPKLEKRGVAFSYGDISSADVLEHAHHGEAKLVISTIPDAVLRGCSNKAIVQTALKVWPESIIIATAENSDQKKALYDAGANYVIQSNKLCAERLQELLGDWEKSAFHGSELANLLEKPPGGGSRKSHAAGGGKRSSYVL